MKGWCKQLSKKSHNVPSGIGIGYTSIMIIFVIICLTVLAVLSYTSSDSNDSLNQKSRKYMTEYYNADLNAKKTLSEIDFAVYDAIESFFFDMTFEDYIAEMEDVSLNRNMQGYSVSYFTAINENQDIFVELYVPLSHFPGTPRYDIVKWQIVNSDEGYSYDENPLNVWDGNI